MKKSICLFTAFALAVSIFIIPISTFAASSQTQSQDFANVVLFAHFSDDDEGAAFFTDTETRDKIIDIYDGSHGRSFTNYMKQISYDQFRVKNIFPQDNGSNIISCELSISEAQAKSGNHDTAIISQVLNKVPDIKNHVIDYDNDGFIDNLTIILKGDAADNAPTSSLTPHKSDYPDPDAVWSGKHIGTYNILDSSGLMEETFAKESGVIAHEFLHSLGYPDLYTSDGASVPVFTWDILGSTSRYPQYPLAYLRMHFSEWLDIETVSSSRTGLTLHTQDNAEGNQAFILKSPLNEHELFVVEFRKKADAPEQYLSEDTLDAKIGGSGIIVYRVDTTVEQLSNHFGQTGIYVFRPQPGQTGYDADEKICVQQGFLSAESGRTAIGSADYSKTLEDGALTYSDGSNSGIVISNVSSSVGNTMTFDVSIPDASSLDTWTNTNFINDGDFYSIKNTAAASDNDTQYLTVCSDGIFTTYQHKNSQWQKMGASFSESATPVSMQLFIHNNQLYLGYDVPSSQKFILKKYDTTAQTWKAAASLNLISGFEIKSIDNSIYIAASSGDSKSASLYQWNGSKLQSLGTFFGGTSGFCGQPRLAEADGQIYASVRNANGDKIQIFRYSNGAFTTVSDDTISSNTYDMESLGSKLYVAGEDENHQLTMYSYNGDKWTKEKSSGIGFYDPVIVPAEDKLYMLLSSSASGGYTKVIRYEPNSNEYAQEGINVDSAAGCFTMTLSGNHLYASYILTSGNQIKVKHKEVPVTASSPERPSPSPSPKPTVSPTSISSAKVSLEKASYTYTRTAIKPKVVSVVLNGKTLISGTDYTVSYSNNINPGINAAVIITGKGNYKDSLTEKFTIKVPNLAATKSVRVYLNGGHDDLRATWSKVSGATGYYVYYKKSTAKSYTLLGTTTSTAYKKANLADGTAYSFRIYPYVKINGKVYKDSSYRTSSNVYTLKKVSKPKIKKTSKKYIKITWTNILGENGYQIARSTKKSKGYKVIKTINYKQKTINIKVTRNKKYYYRIRAYKTVNGKKIYGPWSSPKAYRLR